MKKSRLPRKLRGKRWKLRKPRLPPKARAKKSTLKNFGNPVATVSHSGKPVV
jgi:hypothetical protein